MNKLKSVLFVACFFIFSVSYGQSPPQKGKNGKRPNPKEVIKKHDINQDGKISFEEAQQADKGPLKRDFASIDKNEDGFVTLNEFKAFKPKRSKKGNRK